EAITAAPTLTTAGTTIAEAAIPGVAATTGEITGQPVIPATVMPAAGPDTPPAPPTATLTTAPAPMAMTPQGTALTVTAIMLTDTATTLVVMIATTVTTASAAHCGKTAITNVLTGPQPSLQRPRSGRSARGLSFAPIL